MTIIEIKNREEEKRKEIEKIKALWDIELPEKFRLEGCLIIEGKWFEKETASITINEDVITINFKYEEDYKKLKKYFEESKTKFKLLVKNYYDYQKHLNKTKTL